MTFFDTNATRRRLEASGFTPEQADGAVTIVSEIAGQTLVTQTMLDQRLREMEHRLTVRMAGMLAAAVAILATLDRLAG